MLSTYLSWLDADHPEEEKLKARELWAEIILGIFDSYSIDTPNGFLGRDAQYSYENAVRIERQGQENAGIPLVAQTLLLSDSVVALGGRALIDPTPVTGYPYPSLSDLMDVGGVKELRLDDDILSDSFGALAATVAGAEACGDYLRGHSGA